MSTRLPEAERASGARAQWQILVVDDDIEQTCELVDLFEHAGFGVVGANSASEAMDILRSRTLKLVLIDLKMPQIDGYRLAQAAHAIDPRVPIILMSGNWEAIDEIQKGSHSLFAVIQKPLNPEWLLETARALVH